MSDSGRSWVPRAAAAVAVLTGVFLAGAGAAYVRPEASSVAFWWPAAGLSVALVASLPRSWAPGLAVAVAVVSGAANLVGGQTPELSAAYGVGNALEALVAGIVAVHGGRIGVESESGTGTTFSVRLPLVGEDGAGPVTRA